jgi:hypothetical protein
MQTFLPYPDFKRSAEVLDNDRLRKQKIEATQILETISGRSKAWAAHPAIKMWVGFEEVLNYYRGVISEECEKRGFLGGFAATLNGESLRMPHFIGLNAFHVSHRSNLLRKGRVDAICKKIKNHHFDFTVEGYRSINTWLADNRYNQKNVLTSEETQKLEELMHGIDVDYPNYYRQFGWTEPENYRYFWPI